MMVIWKSITQSSTVIIYVTINNQQKTSYAL